MCDCVCYSFKSGCHCLRSHAPRGYVAPGITAGRKGGPFTAWACGLKSGSHVHGRPRFEAGDTRPNPARLRQYSLFLAPRQLRSCRYAAGPGCKVVVGKAADSEELLQPLQLTFASLVLPRNLGRVNLLHSYQLIMVCPSSPAALLAACIPPLPRTAPAQCATCRRLNQKTPGAPSPVRLRTRWPA